MASAAPTIRKTDAKHVLASRLQQHVRELAQLVNELTIDATFAVAAGEPMAHDDILLARVSALDALETLRGVQAWRDDQHDADWDLDDRVGLAEDFDG
jgi:hypothetical protein